MSNNLAYQIEIRAPRAKVWQMMLGDAGYREWTAAFFEGSYFQGRWETGADMLFLGPSGEGMRAVIEQASEPDFVSIRHLGEWRNGAPVENPDWKDATESYRLSETQAGTTRVDVALTEIPESYHEMMNKTWATALAKLKAICEP